ncbi:MAG: DUF1501 domain-containing protein [Gammaproteobacteria bacterium]|nr:DUF1501 domain-containing protein [Gammaproteobacteria bacterium]
MVGTLGSLAATRALAATGGEYRALVCVFLLGGNDSFNMVVPRSTAEYNEYAAARQNLAITQTDLLPLNPLLGDGADYGLHPSMPEIQTLFNNTDLSITANVGALVTPTTRNQYINNAVPLPPNLFSHNSQQNFWQSVQAFGAQNVGWSGRMAELLESTYPAGALPINISMTGANLLQVGETSTAYNVSAAGAPNINGFGANARRAAVEAMYAASNSNQTHLFESAFARTMSRSFSLVDTLRTALAITPAPTTLFEADGLSQNLRMVAHIIAARTSLNMQRQVFFVGYGGWDTHDSQLTRHVDLLATVSRALSAFQAEMQAINCNDNVTTFTASDFGRTLTSNGDGSDHGWGSHQLVMGGAVAGQNIIGNMPPLVIDGPEDSGRGRIIPSLSVDQYGAALARWFGVPEDQLDAIFPNLANFNERNIGLFDIV